VLIPSMCHLAPWTLRRGNGGDKQALIWREYKSRFGQVTNTTTEQTFIPETAKAAPVEAPAAEPDRDETAISEADRFRHVAKPTASRPFSAVLRVKPRKCWVSF